MDMMLQRAEAGQDTEKPLLVYEGQRENRADNGKPAKPRIVILGSGWGAVSVLRNLPKNIGRVSVSGLATCDAPWLLPCPGRSCFKQVLQLHAYAAACSAHAEGVS